MKNSENQKTDVQKKDVVNVEKIKINLSKGSKDLLTKESVFSRKELYKGMEGKNSEEKKKFRGSIRRELKRFVNSILGKDRSEKERENSIVEFLDFYKKNWKIQDFKIENFSQSKDESDLRDYKNLLKYIQSTLE